MTTKSHGNSHFSNNDAQALPRWGHISMPLLNYDILIHSMHFIESKEDLLSLMRTSRTLYQAGIPHLLRLVRICIYDEPDDDPPINMESFSSFISTDPARRGSIVREVTQMPSRLEVTHEYSQSVRAFAEALAQLHNLTTLAVYWAENWLNHSSISDALASLNNIRALRLDSHLDESNGNKSIDLLGRMASPLRAVSLGFSHVAEYRNLFDILSHFAPALIYLELDKVALTSESEGTVYPNLKF
ncbi:hypothetical protein QCA50_014414 [Cerrena zonata]|uniref:Uncharacterized protein n=1 Tax=Cerrena zonata TaxID=2478898 RepID=A0AAW0FWN3_9APHY